MEIELTSQAARPTLYVRLATSVLGLTEAFDKNFALIQSYLSEIGEQPASAPYAAYYNHDMQNLDVEMGFPVARVLPGSGEIKSGALPAIEKAVCGVHKGSYESLNETYGKIYQYVADNNFEQSGAHYDFYISNPDDTSENELITKIMISVKQKGETKMENMIFCQSCGMPMQKDEDFGTNKDGGKNEDYCIYCYKDGAFTADVTMDEMVAFCAENVDTWDMKITKEEAIAMMRENFPKLKRWQTA